MKNCTTMISDPGKLSGGRALAKRGDRGQSPVVREGGGQVRSQLVHNRLAPRSPCSMEGGKIEARGVSHTVLGGS